MIGGFAKSDGVAQLAVDASGNLWAAGVTNTSDFPTTEGAFQRESGSKNSGGLSRLKDEKFTTYSSKTGLFDDMAFQILEDQNEDLWMSCNRGVFRVSKRELVDFAEGRIVAVNSTHFGVADGMRSRECNGGFQPAGYKTRDGKLWFPTLKGVAMIAPAAIRLNRLAPPVISEVQIQARRV